MFKKLFKREDDVNGRVKKIIQRNQRESLKEIDREDEYDILLGLDNIDVNLLQQQLDEQWDNIYLQKFIEDIFDYLGSYANDDPEDIYRHYLKVQEVLSEDDVIISTGTFRSEVNTDSVIFSLKNSQNKENLLREYVIGRELDVFENPVFLRMYGVLPCSRVLAVEGEVISFCQTDNETSIVFQYLNEKAMIDIKLGTEDFFIVFIILLNALQEASSKKFTHYDLHNETVYLKKLKFPHLVKINLPGLSIKFVKTRYFPFITNYSLSRITAKEGDIYATGYEEMGIGNSYFPMYDIYKFLMFNLSANPTLKIEKLLDVFIPGLNPSNSKAFIEEQLIENKYFIVPEEFRNYSLEKYLKDIKFELEKYSFTGQTSLPIIGKYEPENYFEKYNLLIPREPENSFEGEVAIKLKTGYSPEPTEWVDEIQELIDQLDDFKGEITEPSLSGNSFKKKYFEYTDRFKTYNDQYERLKEQQLIPQELSFLIGEISLELMKWAIRYQVMVENEKLTDERKAINLPRA